jgi:tetratricopeptide (TPR) repeat protein
MLGLITAAVLNLSPMPVTESGYADYLYGSGMYMQAADEYMRIIYLSGCDTLARPEEALRLARCWQELGMWTDAGAIYGAILQRHPDSTYRSMAAMGIASLFESRGDTDGAGEYYSLARSLAVDDDLRSRAEVMRILMEARKGYWEEASLRLDSLAELPIPLSPLSARLSPVVARGEHLSSRSPFWCGLSSALIPGSGQVFCGHYTDGFTSLAVTGATAWLFVESLQEENATTSVLLGWLALSFYGGNIYGGSRAAEVYNGARRRELLEEVSAIIEQE